MYWVPLIIAYHGFAREEACGFELEDIFLDGPVPYFAMRANRARGGGAEEKRGEKNRYRRRYIPIHGELLRLGFREYVEAIRAEGSTELFPELYSDDQRTRGGRKFYANVFRYVQDAVHAIQPLPILPNGKLADLHAIRTAVGSYLESDKVRQSTANRILGHSRRTVQERSYNARPETVGRDQYLGEMLEVLTREIPNLTSHLQPASVRLLALNCRRSVGSAPGRASSRKQGERVSRRT